MDMAMSETLRMYPPTLRLDRICSADNYKFNEITIPKDTVCAVGIWALHHCNFASWLRVFLIGTKDK